MCFEYFHLKMAMASSSHAEEIVEEHEEDEGPLLISKLEGQGITSGDIKKKSFKKLVITQ